MTRSVLTARALRQITLPMIEEAIGEPKDEWAYRCHAISLEAVRSGIFGRSRVARGTATGVGGQHSWVVIGDDCYDSEALVVDLTLWSYVPSAPVIYIAKAHRRPHLPHGWGSVFNAGMPHSHGGEVIALTKDCALSDEAEAFLGSIGPLDARGWMQLALLPVLNWPAAEIITAMCRTPALACYVPVDRIGMLTDMNPGGMYLPEEESVAS